MLKRCGSARSRGRLYQGVLSFACVCLLAILLGQGDVLAQGGRSPAIDVDAEFAFSAALMQADMHDYAAFLAERLIRLEPEATARAKVMQAEALVGARQFDRAAAIIDELPPDSPQTDAVRLALADGYYRIGDMERARTLYTEFFDRQGEEIPEDPDLLRFYREAAYKFAQMLIQHADLPGAITAYDLLIEAMDDEELLRQVRLEQAELLLRYARQTRPSGEELDKLVKRVQELCNAVIWGGMDLWFGRAVICLAEVEAMAEREDDAMRLLQGNLAMLRTLDQTLEEADIPLSESPLAGARSILGELYEREANALLGSRAERERRALVDIGRALSGAEHLWGLIERIHRRDAGLLRRFDGRTDVLRGTPAERMVPLREMDALLQGFGAILAAGEDGQAWSEEVRDTYQAVRERWAALRKALDEHPTEHGITPSVELAFGERFEGRRQLERARNWLKPASERREKAISLLTRSLQQFYGIFSDYPNSSWGEDAGQRVEVVKDRLEDLTGKTVTIRLASGNERKLGLVHMSEGHDLLSRNQYERAIAAYMRGLTIYPEGDESVIALVGLLECQSKLARHRDVRVTATYLAERFAGARPAAQGLLRVARQYFEAKDRTMYEHLYELVTENFREHPGVPNILRLLGEQRWGQEDYAGALVYFARIAERYPRGGLLYDALERIAWAHYLRGDFEQAAEQFQRLVQEAPHGIRKAKAQLSYADCLRQMERFEAAARAYREIMTWLTGSEPVYRNPDLQAELGKIHEQSVFFQAYCLARLDEPADRIPAFRAAALRLYRSFVDTFPESNLAPTALSSMGALYITQEDGDRAAAVYRELTERYPDSEAGRNSRLAMVRSLIDVGRPERARDEVGRMLASPADFQPEHFLHLGLLMLDQGFNLEAGESLQLSIDKLRRSGQLEQNPGMEQRALLGAAQAALRQDQTATAIRYANDLMERYPQSALFYDMRFLLGQAYRQQGESARAMEIMREVFQRASDPTLMNRATLELGRIQEAAGQRSDALASFQRIVLLADPNDAEIRPVFEVALGRSVLLLAQLQRWRGVIESATDYFERFPSGPQQLEVRQALNQARIQLGDGGGQ